MITQEVRTIKDIYRLGLFETNSSSVHSIVFAGPLDKSELTVRNGYIITKFGTFGGDGETYYDQKTKLSYLVSNIWYICHWPQEEYWEEDLYGSYVWKCLEEAVCPYVGKNVLGIRIAKSSPREPDIDHQSVPEYSDVNLVNVYNRNEVQRFIFNHNVGLHLGHD